MTGPIGHGKSTFAKAITEIEPNTVRFESFMVVAEVANGLHSSMHTVPTRDDVQSVNEWLKALPEIIEQVVHVKCTFFQIQVQVADVQRHPVEYEKLFLHIENLTRNPELAKHKITSENKEAYRPILQWLGGYLVKKIDPSIWYAEIIRDTQQAMADGAKICIVGGLRYPNDAELIKKVNGTIIKVYRPDHLQYDALDPTERERDDITADCTIVNNGTIEDMQACARKILEDIEANHLQKTYRTKDSIKS
ncbi:MAG TPA: hypothetical protein VLE69_02965 [Candidatus Saccharimonadales bacterium]|nr:hypothetical protein [Candidatus Saccharimonadales bacterium]